MPDLSNRWAQMSWSLPEDGWELPYELTQTATDVPLDELALAEPESAP